MKAYILLATFCMSITGCQNKQSGNPEEETGKLKEINIEAGINNTVPNLPLSNAVEKLDFVTLETTSKSLLRRIDDIKVTGQDIFILDGNEGIFRFSRDGKFLNKIGKKGEGPGEYMYANQIEINEEEQEVYLMSFKNINVYNYDGSFKKHAMKQRHEQIFYGSEGRFLLFKQFYFLNNKLAILYPENAEQLWSYALTDSSFSVRKCFYNSTFSGHEAGIKENHGVHWGWKNCWIENFPETDFYNGQFRIMYYGNDTLYQFNETKTEFEPIYALTLGERPTFEMAHLWIKDPAFFKYLWVYNMYDTRDYLYFTAGKSETLYTLQYNKRDGKSVCTTSDSFIKETAFPGSPNFVHRRFQREFRLQNDISGGLPFVADYKSSGKYWIDELNPGEFKESLDTESLKNETVKDEAARKQLLKFAKELSEDDNPALIIATLK